MDSDSERNESVSELQGHEAHCMTVIKLGFMTLKLA